MCGVRRSGTSQSGCHRGHWGDSYARIILSLYTLLFFNVFVPRTGWATSGCGSECKWRRGHVCYWRGLCIQRRIERRSGGSAWWCSVHLFCGHAHRQGLEATRFGPTGSQPKAHFDSCVTTSERRKKRGEKEILITNNKFNSIKYTCAACTYTQPQKVIKKSIAETARGYNMFKHVPGTRLASGDSDAFLWKKTSPALFRNVNQ